jgi:hypothetical protein
MKAKISLVLLGSLMFYGLIANDVSVSEWLDSGPLPVRAPGFIKGPNIQSEEFGPRYILSNTYLDLDRGKFLVIVKSLYTRGDENKWWIKAKVSGEPLLGTTPVCGMNIHHLLEGIKLGNVSISADGSMVMVNYSRVDRNQGCSHWQDHAEFQESRNNWLSLDAIGEKTLLYQTG